MKKSSFRFLSLVVAVAIILSTVLIPTGILAGAQIIIDEFAVQEKIDDAVNSITDFGNYTTDEQILNAITGALGSDYAVTEYIDFQKEAAVNGAKVQIGMDEYFTRTAAGKISGKVLVKTAIDQYLFSFEREITPVIDNETYVYAETDVVPDANYTVTADVVYNNTAYPTITDVKIDGHKVMVIDGDALNAQRIDATAFHTTGFTSNGDSKLAGIEVVVLKNIGITRAAFAEAQNLEVAILDSNVTVIGKLTNNNNTTSGYNFDSTPELTYVSLCDGIQYISAYDFQNTSKLKGLVVPNSVTAIGCLAFSNSGIESVKLPEKVTNGKWFDTTKETVTRTFANCKNLISVKIPEGVTEIPSYAFTDNTKLENVTFGSTLVSIGANAFRYCNALQVVELPESLDTMAKTSFFKCENLDAIVATSPLIKDNETASAASVVFGKNNLVTKTKVVTWTGSALGNANKGGPRGSINRFVDIGQFYSVVPDVKVTTASTFENFTIKVQANLGKSLPKRGILLSYKTADGVVSMPIASINEEKTEYKYNRGEIIVDDFTIDLNQIYSREDLLAIQRNAQAVLDAAVEDGTINATTTEADVLNLLTTEISDNRVRLAFIGNMDKQTPVNSAEISLDGNLLEKTEARDGYISGAIGIKAGNETAAVIFSKELKAETVKYAYTSADVTSGKLVVIDNATQIGDTYKNNVIAETVIVKNNVTSIADGAFSGCSNLKVAVIGANIATLGKDMFKDATLLETVELSDTITTISANAFGGAASLKSLIFPAKFVTFAKNGENYGQFVNSGVEDVILPKTVNKETVKNAVFNANTRIYYDGETKKQTFAEAVEAISNLFDNYTKEFSTKEKLQKKLNSLITNSDFKVTINSFKFRVNRVITDVTLSTKDDGITYNCGFVVDKTFIDAALQEIANYATDALKGFKVTNDTTAEDVMDFVKDALDDDDYEYKWIQIFDKTRTIDGAKVLLEGKTVGTTPTENGRITGVIGITKNGETATVPVDLVIKAKVETYSYKNSDKAPTSCFTINSQGKLELYNPGSKVYPLVIIPDGVKQIDHGSGFSGATSTPQTIIMPDSLTNINWSTFKSNSSTEVMILSENVTKLSGYNFLDAKKLKYIRMSDNLRIMGPRVFTGCEKLVSIKLPSKLAYIDHAAFGGNALKEITIPENVELIYFNAFRGKDKLDAADTYFKFLGLEKITVLSKNVRYLDSYMHRNDPTKSADKETSPQVMVEHKEAEQFPARWHHGATITIASYKGSTTDVLVKKNNPAETGTYYNSVYLEQSYLDAINAAEEVMSNIPSDTETSKYLKQFVEEVITNEDVTVTVTDFAYDGVKVKGTVKISTVVDGVEYSSLISGSKKLKISGYKSMVSAIKKVFSTYKFTDETTAADIEAAVAKAIDSGSAKISWSVPYISRESIGGAYIKAPGVYREIKGVDGHAAGYLHIEYRGKKTDIKLDRTFPCKMETLKYSTVSKEEEFTITNRSIYAYNGNAEVVVFPDSVEGIQPNVFFERTGVKAIIINDKTKKLGYQVFKRCYDLEAVYIPEICADLAQAGTPAKQDKEMGAAFDTCSSLKYVRMSRYTTVIPYFSFTRCSSLKEFYIHEGIEKICQRSFWQSCGPLETRTIVLPSSLTLFHTWAFAGVSGTEGNVNFTEIHILSDNLKYENSAPEYPAARPLANFLNHPVELYYPEGADVSYAKDVATVTFVFKETKQTVAQAAVDMQRLVDDFAVTEETTAKDINKKIDKLITNKNIKYKWTSPFKMQDVEQKQEGKITGAIKVYDKRNPELSFTVQVNTSIPLFQWIDDRVITILDSDMPVSDDGVSVVDKNNSSNASVDTDNSSNIVNYIIYAGIAVFACAVITIILVIIIKKKKAKKAE